MVISAYDFDVRSPIIFIETGELAYGAERRIDVKYWLLVFPFKFISPPFNPFDLILRGGHLSPFSALFCASIVPSIFGSSASNKSSIGR